MKYHSQWALISSRSNINIGHHSLFFFVKVVPNKNIALKIEAPLLFSLEANWDMLLPSLIPWKMEENYQRAAGGIYFRPKNLPHSLLNSAYFIFSRKEEGEKILPIGISCRWFRLRLSSLRDARSPICTGRCVISLQDASNCIRVFIFPISSGKLTSLLLLTIKPEKKGDIISLFFFRTKPHAKCWF